MKKKNLLKITAVVMILAMALTMLIACGPKDDEPVEPPKPTFTAKDAAGEIADAIVNSLGQNIDTTKPVGFEYSLNIPNSDGEVTINLKGVLDTKDAQNTRLYMDFVENYDSEKKVFSISSDDSYLYFDSVDTKKKFRAFDLATNLVGATLPGYDDISGGMIGQLPGIVFDMIMDLGEDAEFEHEVDPDEGITINTIHGSFAGLAPLIGGVVDGIIPGVGTKLGEYLGKVNIELTAIITKDKKIDFAELSFDVDGKDQDLGFTSKLENTSDEWTPVFDVPASYDERYIETNLLNFTVDGTFALKSNDLISATSPDRTKATYNYSLRVDINPFEMLDAAIFKDASGNVVFDQTKLFNITTGGFYLNVSHDCEATKKALGVETCPCGKGASKGTILTAAFSPKEFGNKTLNVAINMDAVLPTNFMAELCDPRVLEMAGLPAPDLENAIKGIVPFLSGVQTITLDLGAALESTAVPQTPATASEGVAMADSFLDDYNPVSTVVNVLDLIRTIKYSPENGVRFDIDPIVAIVKDFEPKILDALYDIPVAGGIFKSLGDVGAFTIPNFVDAIFSKADYVQIKADAVYANPAINDFKYKDEFLKINDVIPAPIDPIVSVAPVMKDGIAEFGGNGVQVFDEDGKALPVSANEWKAIMEKGTVKVTGTTMSGQTVEKTAGIVAIQGLDLSKVDVAQEVLVVVKQVEGMLSNNLFKDVVVPSFSFKTKITVDSIAENGAVFSQAESDKKIDPAKAYKYGDLIDNTMNLTITYNKKGADGAAITKTYGNITSSINTHLMKYDGKKKSQVVNAVDDFELLFEKYGFEHKLTLKVDSVVTENVIEMDAFASEDINKFYNASIVVDGNKVTVSGAKFFYENGVKFTWKDGEAPKGASIETKYKDNGKFDRYLVSFEYAGDYELTMTLDGGFSVTYKIHVTIPGAPAPVEA